MCSSSKLSTEVKFVWTIGQFKEIADMEKDERAISPPFATFCFGPGFIQVWHLELGIARPQQDSSGTVVERASNNSNDIELGTTTSKRDQIVAIFIRVYAERNQKMVPLHECKISILNLECDVMFSRIHDHLYARPEFPEPVAFIRLGDLERYSCGSQLTICAEFAAKPTDGHVVALSAECETSTLRYFTPKGTFETSVCAKVFKLGNKAVAPIRGHGIDSGFRRIFDTIRGDGIESYADVRLICGEQTFHCHRVVLAQRSSTFQSCFASPGYVENQTNVIRIKDISSEVLFEVLRYLYCGWIEDFTETIEELLYAVEKYQIQGLREVIERNISQRLGIETACEYLLLADKFSLLEIKKEAARLVLHNRQKIILTSFWSDVAASPQLITEIFKMSIE